jgi:peptidoglycan/LPS O-acetylase OafA/YrhL
LTIYRQDIDGLRALAVLAVIAFHAFPGRISGGFVGVDVFFVISGYLITCIIYKEIIAGKFSVVNFYARRIRRIFPALICVLLASLALGWLVLFPEEYARLAIHVVGGAFFFSNFLLWSEAGYFDVAAHSKPLLHLWSLGVEEQYYLLWPLVLLGIWSFLRNHFSTGLVIAGIAVISFTLNIFLITDNSTAVFYSPATRIWELLIGALLAVCEHQGRMSFFNGIRYRDTVAICGTFLIAGSVAFANAMYPFPGWIALAPTLGATLLIAAGPHSWINSHIFASRPAVFIGQCSYPFYLWHWVLLSFVYIYEPEIYSPIAEAANTDRIRSFKLVAVLISFFAAILTYQLIEKKISKLEPKSISVKLIFAIVLIACLGMVIYLMDGFANLRRPIDGPSKSNLVQPMYLDCRAENGAIFNSTFMKKDHTCTLKGSGNNKLDILIFGDSHGMDFYRGIERGNVSIGLFEANACMPFVGFEKDDKGTCSANLKRFMKLVEFYKPTTIVFSLYFSRFYIWYEGKYNLNEQAQQAFKRLSAISDLIVMLDVPILTFNPDNCRSRPIKKRVDCAIPIETYSGQKRIYEKGLRDASIGISNILFFDPERLFCSGSLCFGAKENVLLYRDSHHLTNEGSVILGNWFLGNYSMGANVYDANPLKMHSSTLP